MKKKPLLCLLLCLILTMWLVLPAFATETSPETDPETGETVASETEPGETGPTEATEPIPDPVTAPATFPEVDGDASVEAGCRTINGKTPLTTNDTLLPTAEAALLYERNTGVVLYAKNADERMFPASLTKVMTCLLVLENLTDMQEMVTVSEEAVSNIDPDGSTANLQPGEQMSVENLLYCLMVASANDAGAVLAERVAGSESAFVEMMNTRAAELGCVDTHFVNAHGLHDENHYTTARDLAKIMLAAVELPEFRKLDSTAVYTVPATNLSEERDLYTTNFLLGKERIEQFYDKRVTGGKTGFTSAAGRCLMCTAEDEDLSLLSVVLNAKENVLDDGYTVTYYGNFEESGILLDYGFDNFKSVQVTLDSQSLGQFPVTNGKNAVIGGPAAELRALLPLGYKQEELSWRCQLGSGTGSLAAPVKRGQNIGICRVWYGACCVAQTDMVALTNSEERTLGVDVFLGDNTEQAELGGTLKTAGMIFLVLVALVALAALVLWVRNLVIRARRRRRRRERNAARRTSGKNPNGRGPRNPDGKGK